MDYKLFTEPDAIKRTTAWHRMLTERTLPTDQAPTPKAPPTGWKQFVRETFTSLYSQPRAVDNPAPEFRYQRQFWDTIERMPDWQRVQRATKGFPELAAKAAKQFLGQIAEELDRQPEPPPPPEPNDNPGPGVPGDGDGGNPTDLEQWAEQVLGQNDKGNNPMRSMMRKALQDAAKQVEDSKKVMDIVGWDLSNATPTKADWERAAEIARQVDVSALARLLGQLLGELRATNQKHMTTASQEIAGVVPGNDLGRVLPQDLALLALDDEAYEIEFYRRWQQRSLMQYRIDPPKGDHQGPFVILLDSSGSMRGERWVQAQAFTMALLKIAKTQNRAVYGVPFSSQAETPMDLTDPGVAMQFVTWFLNGGTNYDDAITKGLDVVKGVPDADLVLLTDGACDVSQGVYTTLQASPARLFVGLVYGGSAANVQEIADGVFTLDGNPAKGATALRMVAKRRG